MPVTISGNGSVTGLTDWEATSVTHPDSEDTNITLADDGSVVFDSIPTAIQSAIDAVPVLAGIGSNVVQAVKTDAFTFTNTTFANITGLTVTITPSSATSKILLIASVASGDTSAGGVASHLRFFGGNSTNYVGNAAGSRTRSFAARDVDGAQAVMVVQNGTFLDSPATTSAVTYSVQALVSAAATGYINRSRFDGDSARSPRAASSLTAIEVAA